MSSIYTSLFLNQYIIREAPNFFLNKLIVESLENVKLFTAIRKQKLFNVSILIYEGDEQQELFRVEQDHRIFKKIYSIKDAQDILIGTIELGLLQWKITIPKAGNMCFVNIERNMNAVTSNTRIVKFTIVLENQLIADFQYCDIKTSRVNFYDKDISRLDRRIGIAIALLIIFNM